MARKIKGAVRWVKREGLHVTLHFFGQISPETVDKVENAVTPVVSACSPLRLRIKGIGAFPSLRNPRVLWAGIEEEGDGSPLRTLQAALAQVLEENGFPIEKRPFKAHVTFGRARRTFRVPWEQLVEIPSGPAFFVRELILFQSILTPKGAIYRPLKHFPLGGDKNNGTS